MGCDMIQSIESKCDVCRMIFTILFAAGSIAQPIQYCPFCGVTIDSQHLVLLEKDMSAKTDLEDSFDELLTALPFKVAPVYDPAADRLSLLLENVAYIEQAVGPNVVAYRAKDDRRVVGFAVWDLQKVVKSG